MRAHELVQEWKEFGNGLTLTEYKQQYSGKIGLGSKVEDSSDPDIDEVDGMVEEMEARVWGREDINDIDPSVDDEPVAPVKKNGQVLSKKNQARVIFNDIAGRGHGRKMTIQRFMDVLGMSKTGASTYYHNFNSGKW